METIVRRSIETYGLRLGIQTNKPEFLARLLDHVPPGWRPARRPVDRTFFLQVAPVGSKTAKATLYQLFEEQEIRAKSKNLDEVFDSFARQVKLYVAEMARRRVFLHAGAVEWEGKAIIVPGRSLSGKTSLVAEMVRAGATYYSDEYAVLDTLGRVHPYAAPLSVREPGLFAQRICHVKELGGVTGVKPLPVGLVVLSHYEADARWRPRQLSAGKALLELLANAVPVRRRPRAVISTLHKVLSNAIVLKGTRGEAKETAGLILSRQRCW